MPIQPDHRAGMLQFFAKDCSVEDLKAIRADIEHELSRRISQKLVLLTPGNRVRFLMPAVYTKGLAPTEEVGTLIRIHRRSMLIELMNREEISVSGDRFIEIVPEIIYQDLRHRRNIRGETDTSHIAPALDALEAARRAAEVEPVLDPRSVQLPDEVV